MKKSIRSIIVLVSICAVVSILMALTNSVTAPIIAENDAKNANAALLQVLPDGGSFETVDMSAYTLPSTVTAVYRASNGGCVVQLTTSGYSSGMVIMCGINPDGTVYLNGTELPEPYVQEKALGECDVEFPMQIIEKNYFMMGDQRETSIDSRSSVIGCIAEDQMVGKIFCKFWPLSEFEFVN